MIWASEKWVKLAAVVVVFVFGVFLVQKVIKDGVAKETQQIQEKFAKQLADEKLHLEQERIDEEAECKKQIVDLQTQLEKAKILIEKMKKQGKYSSMVKKDLGGFMKEVDSLLDLKGKPDVKK